MSFFPNIQRYNMSKIDEVVYFKLFMFLTIEFNLLGARIIMRTTFNDRKKKQKAS